MTQKSFYFYKLAFSTSRSLKRELLGSVLCSEPFSCLQQSPCWISPTREPGTDGTGISPTLAAPGWQQTAEPGAQGPPCSPARRQWQREAFPLWHPSFPRSQHLQLLMPDLVLTGCSQPQSRLYLQCSGDYGQLVGATQKPACASDGAGTWGHCCCPGSCETPQGCPIEALTPGKEGENSVSSLGGGRRPLTRSSQPSTVMPGCCRPLLHG